MPGLRANERGERIDVQASRDSASQRTEAVTATHASFFSGAGGLDLGLERAGWRTVSFSEIDPYASAVLAQHWPNVPNLGSITELTDVGESRDRPDSAELDDRRERDGRAPRLPRNTSTATLWSGGFPCQDLSVAGKRRGMVEGTRSNLAYAFLDLVERHRPPAVLLENVPGLLSSHGGRDFGALLGTLGQLGYGWAYRILDARHFGVPQRRRRVFILGIHARIDPSGQRAAEVLSVGTRCQRHPATGHETGKRATGGAVPGVDIARAVTGSSGHRHDDDTDTLIARVVSETGAGWWTESDQASAFRAQGGGTPHHAVIASADIGSAVRSGRHGDPGIGRDNDEWRLVTVRPSSDPDRDGAPDGLAGRSHHRDGVVNALDSHQGGADDNEAQAGHLVTVGTLRVGGRASGAGDSYDNTPWGDYPAEARDDVMLPIGLDSHRYRCCGNGVVSSVSEWIGTRLMAALA